MLTEYKTLDNTEFLTPYKLPPKETVYFDIETTGFSSDVTALYLIGCIYHDECSWKLIQWFAEDKNSEKEAIIAFNNLIRDKKYLICYNGTTFDLPYLRKKAKQHGVEFNTEDYCIVDFYRVFSSFNKFLGLKGLRQKDVEAYLGIERNDKFSGGELIEWYSKYLKLRFVDTLEKKEIFDTLILHNCDDLVGMAKLTSLYNFLSSLENITVSDELYKGDFDISRLSDKLVISTDVAFDVLKNHQILKDGYSLNLICENKENKIVLTIEVLEAELKLFYKDYKNYFFLPKEDMVVHKSLAFFVDKENKEKAQASNCYSKHRGVFFKLPKETSLPVFKTDYKDKTVYTLLNDKVINSKENMTEVFKTVVKHLLK